MTFTVTRPEGSTAKARAAGEPWECAFIHLSSSNNVVFPSNLGLIALRDESLGSMLSLGGNHGASLLFSNASDLQNYE